MSSPIAHASIGLLAKPAVPKAPLWALIAATQVPDLLFFAFEAAGIEHQAVIQTDLSHGITYLSPALIVWSHGLFMGLVWSAVVAALAFLLCRNSRTSIVLGLLVFSHCLLDFVFYPNIPLFLDGSPLVGLGLATSGPGFIAGMVMEAVLTVGGIVVYLRWRRRTAARARKKQAIRET